MFQYADLSQLHSEDQTNEENNLQSPSNNSQTSKQPEEEPMRRMSHNLQSVAEQFAEATNTPVPDSPMSAAPEEPATEENVQSEDAAPSTASFDTDQETSGNDMEPVYNMTMIENGNHNDIVLEDEETIWSPNDEFESVCASFAFDVP